MKQLRKYIETLLDGGKIRGLSLSPVDIWALVDIYNGIVRKEKVEFINGNAKKVLDKCNIETVPYGIGWRVQ